MLLKRSALVSFLSVAIVSLIYTAGAFAATPANTHPKPTAGHKPAEKAKEEKTAKSSPEPILENLVSVTPQELKDKPQEYLGKNIKFNAIFFAFNSLALDYKPAYQSSKTHLSFCVLTPNSHVPLSELKLAMMIPKEKDPENLLLASLKDGDQIEVVGKVFSAALDDPWVEVFKLKKIGSSAEENKTASASAESKASVKKADETPGKSDK